jgi:hypothetical protein
MARKALTLASIAAALAFSAMPASTNSEVALGAAEQALPIAAQANLGSMNVCGEREQHFNEEITAVGLVDQNAMVEIFASEGGSWTIIATGTDGLSCILSAGEGWESTAKVRGADA